jgi:hypothetical protein
LEEKYFANLSAKRISFRLYKELAGLELKFSVTANDSRKEIDNPKIITLKFEAP